MVIADILAVAISSQFLRRDHAHGLDAVRLTLAGQFLLGRIFSGWNSLAYAAGIALAAGLDTMARRG